jgi:hypothetical protein
MAGAGNGHELQPRQLAQAALHPVADHGIADFLGGREANARRAFIAAGAHLNHHARHGGIRRPGGGNKILPSLQAFHVSQKSGA